MNRRSPLVEIAFRIKEENDEIEAPVNDILDCLRQLDESSALSLDNIEKTVVGMFISDEQKKYENKQRNPEKREIIMDGMSDKYKELVLNPR